MIIRINETDSCDEPEIIINCKKKTEEILKIQEWLKALDKKIMGIKNDNTYILDASNILYIDTVDKHTGFRSG